MILSNTANYLLANEFCGKVSSILALFAQHELQKIGNNSFSNLTSNGMGKSGNRKLFFGVKKKMVDCYIYVFVDLYNNIF